MVWYNVTRVHDVVRYGMLWCCLVWRGMEFFRTKWYGIDSILCYCHNGAMNYE
jgi:hypothetical protein